MKKMKRQIAFLWLAILAGCIPPPTSQDIAVQYQQKAITAAKQELNELSEQRSELITQYKTCKTREQQLMKQLSESQIAVYSFAKEKLQEDYLEAMNNLLYAEVPALKSLSNPRGLSVDWWNYTEVYQTEIRIARENRKQFLDNFVVPELMSEFTKLLQLEYNIRDQADDIFFREQHIKQRLRKLPDEVWKIENVSLLNLRSQSNLTPRQEAMLKLMLDEQSELIYRPQAVTEWWKYQKTFGFDDYRCPLSIKSE